MVMSNSGGGGGTIVRPPLTDEQLAGRACALCAWTPEDGDIRFMRPVGRTDSDVEIVVCSRAVPKGCWLPTMQQLTALHRRGISIYLNVAQSVRTAEVPARVHDAETGYAPLPGQPGYGGN